MKSRQIIADSSAITKLSCGYGNNFKNAVSFLGNLTIRNVACFKCNIEFLDYYNAFIYNQLWQCSNAT